MSRTEDLFNYGLDLESRMLYLGSVPNGHDSDPGTDNMMAERAIKGLWLLDETPGDILIIMNNHGGDEYHGLAIYDAIQACRNKVKIEVMGHAMSMCSIILAAGDERIMSPNSRLMLHYGTPIVADSGLHALEQQTWSKECDQFRQKMERFYLQTIQEKHPNFTLEQVRQLLAYGTILTATETVELGLADYVKVSSKNSRWPS